ncbi:hypothetical protein ACFSTC_31000 [Nonomuraea ferruginea]
MRWAYFLLVASALWWIAPPAHAAQEEPPGRAHRRARPALGRRRPARDPPNLWRLAGESDLGSVSVKTVGTLACPFDGWLSVSARRPLRRRAALRAAARAGAHGRGRPGAGLRRAAREA